MELTIERFRSAHESSYEKALSEIRAGRKESHWIWYIFPQIQGLGHSTRAMYYAIENREEALEYWNDLILRSHMVEICEELLKHKKPIEQIMGYPDNLKLCSSMTLFWMVTGEPIFKAVLNQFYHGTMDRFTVERLT